ncbi:MAG: tRNA lysidine(34) synthetase TilS [Anaerolineae bacterium]|nr:tRNA lysidine(34) synthetase TilS [Anaerolineae bacterium]
MGSLVQYVHAYITRHNLIARGDTVIVAVSGGADSLVLLHVLGALRNALDLRLHVATLDHGIRGAASGADVAFVREIAAAWGVPVTAGSVDVPAYAAQAGIGIEAAARARRYAFLAEVAESVGARRIATGHNQDDQAETVLLHLLRGSGLDGLRGMLPMAPIEVQKPIFTAESAKNAERKKEKAREDHLLIDTPSLPRGGRGLLYIIRPLLHVSRTEIDAYAAAHDLAPREDATNRDLDYTRNRLRHEIIPLLEMLNPNVKAAIARTADILRADADWIAARGQAALHDMMIGLRTDSVVLNRGQWHLLTLAEKRAVLRQAVQMVQGEQGAARDLTFAHIENAIRVADYGATGAAATLPGGLMLRILYDDILTLGPTDQTIINLDAPAIPPTLALHDHALSCAAGESLQRIFDGWLFETFPFPVAGDLGAWHSDPLAAALMISPGTRLMLRTRQPGDRFLPRGMEGRSQKLADTLTNMKVPAVWRDHIPLLVAQDTQQIAWFVAPTADGVRGRVAAWCAIPTTIPSIEKWVVVRWSHVDSIS